MEEDLLKDVEQIKEFQLEEIKGGADSKQVEQKCGACCQLLGGGGGASKELSTFVDQPS
ncbi:hypothetical protein [Bacteroides ihuae]|uniref:hypothetical protein n=1 Tax=Bacteroides ihuae TaxID=1852362 RepID=UPI0013565AFF|nr:hypothetical protein [Bacteroides ihuae]